MPTRTPQSGLWAVTPSWIIMGAFLILAPLFVFITLESVNRQNKLATELLVEKGDALIRSFEAGARTGMMGMQWGGTQVQRLLMETSQQPDIRHLLVTDQSGRILADSDPQRIGESYGQGLDLKEIAASREPHWRRLPAPEGQAPTLEVFRQFAPTRGRRGPGSGHGPRSDSSCGGGLQNNDWCQAYMEGLPPDQGNRQIIFVGLDMGPVEASRRAHLEHTVIMAAILLLVGFAAMVLLFLAQAYRTTRMTLSQVQVFAENLVEHMPVGLIAVDPQGCFTSINQTAERLLQLDSAALLTRPAKEFLPAELLNFLDSVLLGQGPLEREVLLKINGNRSLPLDLMGTPLERDDGTRLGALILLRDLTELHHLKEEVARSRRLVSIGKLAAGVAHEIRNPLSSIKGFATYFKQRYQDNPADAKTAEIMIQEVERLNRVISQLLDFARPPALHKQDSDLLPLIQRSLETIQGLASKHGIRVETRFENPVGQLPIDRDQIKQVLLNLYLNAIDAMEGGGVLTVSLRQDDGGGGVWITVSDTGLGIEEKDLEHVFDPYFTTKSSGTGLGLAIAHNIVEAHGGEVSLTSTPGKGTQVQVHLPA